MSTIHLPPEARPIQQQVDVDHIPKAAGRAPHGAVEVCDMTAAAAPTAPPHLAVHRSPVPARSTVFTAVVRGTAYDVRPAGA